MARSGGWAAPPRVGGVARSTRPAATAEELRQARALGPRLEVWFRSNGRSFVWREWTDEYRLAVAELLLQRTRAATVARFIPAFVERYPDWQALARVPVATLGEVLAPIGLSRRRADVLTRLAKHIGAERPVTEAAPGVGQYIGRAIAVMTHGARLAMVDSNWVRVLRRVFDGPWMADYRYDPRLQDVAQSVVDGADDVRAANWAMLDLGATICVPRNPRCDLCPLRVVCRYGSVSSAPVEGVEVHVT